MYDLEFEDHPWVQAGKPTVTKVINPDTGVVIEEIYRLNGRRHREESEGPAFIRRDPVSGNVVFEAYWYRGFRHRDDGPAAIYHQGYAGGMDVVYRFFRFSVLHREGSEGPANIRIDSKGNIESNYFVNGVAWRNPAEGNVSTYSDMPKAGFKSPKKSQRPSPAALRARRRIEAKLKPALVLAAFAIVQGLAA